MVPVVLGGGLPVLGARAAIGFSFWQGLYKIQDPVWARGPPWFLVPRVSCLTLGPCGASGACFVAPGVRAAPGAARRPELRISSQRPEGAANREAIRHSKANLQCAHLSPQSLPAGQPKTSLLHPRLRDFAGGGGGGGGSYLLAPSLDNPRTIPPRKRWYSQQKLVV
jgi:hypothetical protein